MKQVWMLRALRWSYAAFIMASSAVTAHAALLGGSEAHHGGSFVLALATIEFVAAIAFLAERIEIAACAVLLAVFAVAAVLSITVGDYLAPLRFLYFGATAVLIVVSGRQRVRG